MTNLEKIKKAQELLWETHRIIESLKLEDRNKKENQREILSDINATYVKVRNDFKTSLWGEVENEIANKLSLRNLMHVYYDNNIYELEFNVDGKQIIITNIREEDHPEAWDDEYYFEDEDILEEILRMANEEDIITIGELK